MYCEKCKSFVDAGAPQTPGGEVIGSCTHKIVIKLIPFVDAKAGVETCLRSAEDLVLAAKLLSQAGRHRLAFFLVLTAYEEVAKCQRLIDAASVSHDTQADLIVEESLFRYHGTKYRITMDYLEHWISLGEAYLRGFSQRVGLDFPEEESAQLIEDRKEIHDRGDKLRMECLYTDYSGGWIERPQISRERVLRNLKMIDSFMKGFRSSLKHWDFAIS
jgi:AbiV family abortive infection protein